MEEQDSKLNNIISIEESPKEKHIEDDYDRTRATLFHLLEQGKEAIELAMEVARDTEHPRSIEVLSGLMKNVSDINGQLMDLHQKKKKYYEKQQQPMQMLPSPAQSTGDTHFHFNGTTEELQKMLTDTDKEIKNVTPDSDS